MPDAPRFLPMPDPCACTTRLDLIAAKLSGDTLTCTCPTSPEPHLFEAWVTLAASHLYGALDTARDELERDGDFIPDPDNFNPMHCPLTPFDRDACIVEAMRRFMGFLAAEQEG